MFRRPSLSMPRFTVGTFLGELVLIVLGVLLALSVDEWRQSRTREAAAEEAIRSIRAELVSNRELAVGARDYHEGRIGHIQQTLGTGGELKAEDFPRGFVNPARVLSAAWDTAGAAGDLNVVDRELRRTIAVAYAWQERYEDQARSVGALIYERLFESGRDGMVANPEGLIMMIGAFAHREREIIGVLDETLEAIVSR